MRNEGRALMMAGGAFVLAGLAVGCGGGDSNGGDVTTGIAPSKLLSDVTASEAAQACQRLEAGFNQVFTRDVLIRTGCTLQAAAFADTPAACATQRDACIQEANQEGSDAMMALDMEMPGPDCGDGSGLTQCTGTVGQLEACVNDGLDLVSAAIRELSCDDAATFTMDDAESFLDDTEGPPSCDAVDCGDSSPLGME